MLNQTRILVADDEEGIAHLIADVLREEGYDVQCMHDGASVLLAIQDQVPDLVILDNMMPLLSGGEALRTLRAQGFAHPIIMMSANGQRQMFLDSGASGFLAKPFTIDALLQAVAWQLGRS